MILQPRPRVWRTAQQRGFSLRIRVLRLLYQHAGTALLEIANKEATREAFVKLLATRLRNIA